jgi:hypothetical protein
LGTGSIYRKFVALSTGVNMTSKVKVALKCQSNLEMSPKCAS